MNISISGSAGAETYTYSGEGLDEATALATSLEDVELEMLNVSCSRTTEDGEGRMLLVDARDPEAASRGVRELAAWLEEARA